MTSGATYLDTVLTDITIWFQTDCRTNQLHASIRCGDKRSTGSVKAMKSIRMMAAMQRMELYFMAYPGSPSAVRRPRLSQQGEGWKAFLGSNGRNGVTGFGRTVEAALSDFDTRYLRALRLLEAPVHFMRVSYGNNGEVRPA
jgi:hypothetical protein